MNRYNNKIQTITLYPILLILTLFPSCKKIERIPKIETGTVSVVNSTSAMATGVIIDIGQGITDHGHCWDITGNPSISDFKTSLGKLSMTGSFTSLIQNLQEETTYYVKAYIMSKDGLIFYGSESSFTTDPVIVKDADSNIYNVIRIGTQVWMKENLKTTKYNDDTLIPYVLDNIQWCNLTTAGYCWYSNDISNKDIYGALYNWYTVSTGKLCPNGWHVPTSTEWEKLIQYLGGWDIAGGKLKEEGTVHWLSPNKGATNESGFTALPSGSRACFDPIEGFDYEGNTIDLGYFLYCWSSTEYDKNSAKIIEVWREETVIKYNSDKVIGSSVRCIRD